MTAPAPSPSSTTTRDGLDPTNRHALQLHQIIGLAAAATNGAETLKLMAIPIGSSPGRMLNCSCPIQNLLGVRRSP